MCHLSTPQQKHVFKIWLQQASLRPYSSYVFHRHSKDGLSELSHPSGEKSNAAFMLYCFLLVIYVLKTGTYLVPGFIPVSFRPYKAS